jgi:hypothetical protein
MEEHRLRVFENRVLRRIFGPKRDENWGKLHNEELRNLYSSPNIIRMVKSRRTRWAGLVGGMGDNNIHIYIYIYIYIVSLGEPEGKRPLGRPRRG